MFFKSDVYISCKGCAGCTVLYDPVHDENFSNTCGLVVMVNGILCVDIGDDVGNGRKVRFLLFDE